MSYMIGLVAPVLVVILGILSSHAAYRNGVRDTFYELNEPGHPGAVRVREQMKREELRLKDA